MTKSDDYVGMVARCSQGLLGLIMGRKTRGGRDLWVGVQLQGKNCGLPWQSRAPEILGPMAEFLDEEKARPPIRKVNRG